MRCPILAYVVVCAVLVSDRAGFGQAPDFEHCEDRVAVGPDLDEPLEDSECEGFPQNSASGRTYFMVEVDESDDIVIGDLQVYRSGGGRFVLCSPSGTTIDISVSAPLLRIPTPRLYGPTMDATYSDYGYPYYEVPKNCRCLITPPTDLYGTLF
jgi:hypothetical protein